MYGSDPPSSRTTFFRLRPAVSATTVPARSEPVSDTPRSRGSAIIAATCSWVAKRLTYTPSGTPASLMICAIARAEVGQFSACLSMTVLPMIRLGAANLATW